jgi:LPS sulfotransferase NodH
VTLPPDLPTLHCDRLRARFGPGLGPPHPLPDGIALVFLCFTNRTGSNHLAELLAATGAINEASEALNHDELIALADRARLPSVAACLGALMRWNAVAGRFATKLGLAHLPVLAESGLLQACLARARFIVIEREDKLDQAISYEIARQTGAWAAFQPAGPHPPRFSAPRIAAQRDAFIRQHRQLDSFLAANGIVPLRVTYEALRADPLAALAPLAAAIGLPPPAPPAAPRFTRQANARNAEWRARFLAAQPGKT